MVKYYLKDFTNTRSDKHAPIFTSSYFVYVPLNLNPPEVYFRMGCEVVVSQVILRISHGLSLLPQMFEIFLLP